MIQREKTACFPQLTACGISLLAVGKNPQPRAAGDALGPQNFVPKCRAFSPLRTRHSRVTRRHAKCTMQVGRVS